jgi:hypothetical protein
LCALLLRDEEPFAVVLPDVLVDQYESDLKIENLAKIIQIFLALFSIVPSYLKNRLLRLNLMLFWMVWMQMIVGFGNWVS